MPSPAPLPRIQPGAGSPADASPSLSPLWRGVGFSRSPSPRLRREGRGERQLSVIIPTLNAADTLYPLLSTLCGSETAKEVIVVDGVSSDHTVAIAEATGTYVFTAPRGRGIQLAAGAAAASGEWLLFLHADCRLAPEWEDAVAGFVSAPNASGRAGYFDFALDDTRPAARRLERIVAWRC